MVGKCVRIRDKKIFKYRLLGDLSHIDFHIPDETWRFVGDQNAFELEYELQNEITISIILHGIVLPHRLMKPLDYLKFLEKINSTKDFHENTCIKLLIKNKPIKVRPLCIKDVYGIDVFGNVDKTQKYFTYKCRYRGVQFVNSHFMMIGERLLLNHRFGCFVNGKIIVLFPEKGDESEIFTSNFFLMKPHEKIDQALKRFQKEQSFKRFDL